MNQAEIRKRGRWFETRRQDMHVSYYKKLEELGVKRLELFKLCPHPDLVTAPTGKYCPDCKASSDIYRF